MFATHTVDRRTCTLCLGIQRVVVALEGRVSVMTRPWQNVLQFDVVSVDLREGKKDVYVGLIYTVELFNSLL